MKRLDKYGNQGDLNFRAIDKVPDGFAPVDIRKEHDRKRGGHTLALGEHSGHAHTVIDRKGGSYDLYRHADGRHCLVVREAVELLHGTFIAPAKIDERETDKHEGLVLEPGIYEQDYEQAYSPFDKMIRRVQD